MLFSWTRCEKRYFEFLICEIECKGEENITIDGDINTRKHNLDENEATLYHLDYLEKYENLGLIYVWRKVNGEKREYTWYRNSGNGFRRDHFFY